MSDKSTLHIINGAHFFDHYFLLVFPTAALAIAPAWHMSFAEVLLLGSPIYIMFALGTLPFGWIGDRVNRITLIAVFFVGCGVSSLFVAFAHGPISMMIGLGALGFFCAIYHPVGLAHLTGLGLRTGRILAVNGVFGNMGLAAAAGCTGLLADFFGWRAAFAVPGAISLIAGAITARSIGAVPITRESTLVRIKCSIPVPRKTQLTIFLVICTSALLGGLVFNLITISLPKFFDERLSSGALPIAWVGTVTAFVFAIAAFAQLPVGELLDRFGAKPVLIVLLIGEVLALLLLTTATDTAAVVLSLILVTFLFAEIPITTWLVGRYLDSSVRSRAISVENVLTHGVGSTAVPLIAVMGVYGIGFDVQMYGMAFLTIVILFAVLALPTRHP